MIVGGCMLSVALPSQAANPVVSSATMNDGALSVSGSNFGTKPTAAPVYFQDFSSLEDGMTGRASSAAGLTWSDDTNYNPNNSQIISSDGVGGKAMTMFSPTSGSRNTDSGFYPHVGINLPAGGSQGVMMSFWIKFVKLTAGNPTGGGSEYQWKGPRAGVFAGTGRSSNENYAANPKLSSQVYVQSDGLWNGTADSYGNRSHLWTDAPNFQSDIYSKLTPASFNFYSTWIQRESWLKFNDMGQSNGEVKETINGSMIQNLSNLANRTSDDQSLDYAQIFPGVTFLQMKDFEVRISRVYIDTTQARVFLCNAATLTACTKRFLLPPVTWTNTSISAAKGASAPAEYKWVFVSNAAGEINSSGFALATGPVPKAPVVTVQ